MSGAGSAIGAAVGTAVIGPGAGTAFGAAVGSNFGPSYNPSGGGEVLRQLNSETDPVYHDERWRKQYFYLLEKFAPELWNSGDIWDPPTSSMLHAGANRGRWVNALNQGYRAGEFWLNSAGVPIEVVPDVTSGSTGGGSATSGAGEARQPSPSLSTRDWLGTAKVWWSLRKPWVKWLIRGGVLLCVISLLFGWPYRTFGYRGLFGKKKQYRKKRRSRRTSNLPM